MSQTPKSTVCILCKTKEHLEPIELDAQRIWLCKKHCVFLSEVKPNSLDAFVDAYSRNERRRNERRVNANDRRAFWRLTPDRRRESTELGRRSVDHSE